MVTDIRMVELSALSSDSDQYKEYIMFIRDLRTDPRTLPGFIDQISSISDQSQIKYMEENKNNYFIACVQGLPVGFGGVIYNDIRYAVIPYYSNKGIGTEILNYIKIRNPLASGKIKKENLSSIKAFEKAKIKYEVI